MRKTLASLGELTGKTVAITGTSGGLGYEICRYLVMKGATVLQMDRNPQRQQKTAEKIKAEFPEAVLQQLTLDLGSMESVKVACAYLLEHTPDVLIHNAGAYAVPRYTTDAGLDNVFQINYAAPYYMTRVLADAIKAKGGSVVVVGSIAHTYSKTDKEDVQFLNRSRSSLVYGNAKRHLMVAMSALSEKLDLPIAITHPGITPTNITAHYPPWLYAIIKHPMKWIFMSPRKAALCILKGLYAPTQGREWWGPRLFGVWGLPRLYQYTNVSQQEIQGILQAAEEIYQKIK
jgi:NAD(P)-dependent dehydrogenase (short-subunit alcohol dehydrogenase family)